MDRMEAKSVAEAMLSDENLRSMLREALLAQLTPETQQTLITAAIKRIVEPSSSYGSRSAFDVAFDQATKTVTAEVAAEMLRGNTAFIDAVRQMTKASMLTLVVREVEMRRRVTQAVKDYLDNLKDWDA